MTARRPFHGSLKRAGATVLALAAVVNSAAWAQTSWKFAFGSQARPGWVQVAPTNAYSEETGFGFEPDCRLVREANAVVSRAPFYFSTTLPAGNYRVTATLGSDSAGAQMNIKAEDRRLMVENAVVAAGVPLTRAFVVNLRADPSTNAGMDSPARLTLEFNGDNPAVRALAIAPVTVPTVFVIGDSTVSAPAAGPAGNWVQMLPRFFKPVIAVSTVTRGNDGLTTFLPAARFADVFSGMKRGDYLLVEFGQDEPQSTAPDAAAKAVEIFKVHLRKIVITTRAQGATPVLLTPRERRPGAEEGALAGYAQAVREVAHEENCALIDLHRLSQIFFKALGGDAGAAFGNETDLSDYGCYELAKCVVEGLRQDGLPLANTIADDWGDFDPAHPDAFKVVRSASKTTLPAVKPSGK